MSAASNRLSASTVLEAFEQGTDFVLWIRDRGADSYAYVSPSFERVWGTPIGSLEDSARVWLSFVEEEDRERVASAARSVESGVRQDLAYRIRRPDGATRHLRTRAFLVAGEPPRVVGVSEDVTEARELREALARSRRLESLGQLAAGVAHDFNNVLTAIGALSELLEPRTETVGGKATADGIRHAVHLGSQLTRRLLDFARTDSTSRCRFDLAASIRELEPILVRVGAPGAALRLEIPDAPVPILADRLEIEQAVLNLVSNARDATPQGGSVLVRLEGSVRDGASSAVLKVVDDGAGMDAVVRERIFEPLFTTKPKGKGTGMGLAIVFGSVRRAGGTIEVESAPGKGTAFTIRLPLDASESSPAGT